MLANEAVRQGFIGREEAEMNLFCQRESALTVENDMVSKVAPTSQNCK